MQDLETADSSSSIVPPEFQLEDSDLLIQVHPYACVIHQSTISATARPSISYLSQLPGRYRSGLCHRHTRWLRKVTWTYDRSHWYQEWVTHDWKTARLPESQQLIAR